MYLQSVNYTVKLIGIFKDTNISVLYSTVLLILLL